MNPETEESKYWGNVN